MKRWGIMLCFWVSAAHAETQEKRTEPPSTPAPQTLTTHTPTAPSNIDAKTPENIAKAMQDFGYIAKIIKDDDGDPSIESNVSKSKFRVSFYDCTEGKDCKSILISAGWDLQKPIPLEKINEWNKTKRFGKAYIDTEGDPHLDFDLNLDYGGVSLKNFEDTLDWWRISVTEFEKIIRE